MWSKVETTIYMKTKVVMNQDKNRVELDIIVLKWDWRGEEKGIFFESIRIVVPCLLM